MYLLHQKPPKRELWFMKGLNVWIRKCNHLRTLKKTKEHLKWQWMTLMLDPKSDLVLKKKRKKKALAQNSSWHGNVLSRYQMVCEYSNFTSHSLGYHCFSWAVSKENLPATLAHFSGIQLVPILCTSVMTPRFILWSAWSIEENQSCLVKNLIFLYVFKF